MGVLLLFLGIAYVTAILGVLLLVNWLIYHYLEPPINLTLWWTILIFSIVPIASFFLKRYFRKNMRKASWKLKGIAWIAFGLCFLDWLIGLSIMSFADFPVQETELKTGSVIIIGGHLFLMILFYRLSQRIK